MVSHNLAAKWIAKSNNSNTLIYDFKVGRDLPLAGFEELAELTEYFPFYLYQQKIATIPNFAFESDFRISSNFRVVVRVAGAVSESQESERYNGFGQETPGFD